MCGIAGILFKGDHRNLTAGQALINMLDGCQHRGPDSTGFALYREPQEGELRLRFIVGDGVEAQKAIADIREKFAEWGADVIDEETSGITRSYTVKFDGDVQQFSYAMEHAAKLVSIGESLDIIKDIGSAHDVDDIYAVNGFNGTHGLGHVRLATESDVKPEAAHPFWATGFADVAIVHNGQITNYWKMRRRLEKRGFEFHTDNDSELVAVYLAEKLKLGYTLKDALKESIDDLDGTFSFLVSTKDEIGYAKDRLAVKPMVKFEDDDIIAIASEEVSLNKLFPGMALNTMEPPPGTYDTWHK
ncbi:MAG: amidophosphoribosyltransferase [Rhodospirillales bacterium]|jgi:glutamate synthase domain-containing protein 1|nr:amidophosphoribosyltransferase [Rhodospirillales bacterium]MBT4041595.1 amidophosphoribosyltransferase [Rhodospirillales bacterium]MBT4627821.1 amidophosphoribosyltransferase [Rhodospirillales bacterium]MBT5352781.1 amidophosphoribosyltransferase [Rhodospirillales bacterium]MBT5521024.1 amidophosphoribosyltransferase [Rhodospirillales bacterium]